MPKRCNDNNSVTCPNPISINCVIWDGQDLPCFDICNGDSISPLVYFLATSVCELLEDVNVSTVVLSQDFITLLGTKDKTIANLFQLLFDGYETLQDAIDELNTTINETTSQITLDFKCIDTQLDPCTTTDPNNLQQVFQLLINAICETKEQNNTIIEDIGNIVDETINEYLDNLITADLPNRIITQSTGAKYKIRGLVPPHCPIPYFGPLSNFDSTGKGLGNYDGWYICNGNNGTQDARGFTFVGATQNVGGGSVDPLVQPIGGQGIYNVGDKGGKIMVTLTTNQIPAHDHPLTITNNPVSLTYNEFSTIALNTGPGTEFPLEGVEQSGNVGFRKTPTAISGLTNVVGSMDLTGGGLAHENRMPFKATAYIQMID